MYLKSLEVHGFKSFANRLKFEFHDGITAIVGPNGSGKSNVADAVRWVLGEQSAKQLRGSNMQDVIFAGSEARKPLGYAYVSITFDNSDHKLAIAYDEVTVSRRVYRSGESEYLINGANCRLKDVQELFFDTGIGKEGYSIIGQGQIDRILSTKPEERRELFDEAAGIVKFKKRKLIAQKNLEEERLNLSRVEDIIRELELQLEPLSKQSETAKEYLRLRDALKIKEANQFLLEYKKNAEEKEKADKAYKILSEDLLTTRSELEKTKDEYESIGATLADYNKALEESKKYHSDLLISAEKLESERKVIEEQISTILANDARLLERIGTIDADIASKEKEKNELLVRKASLKQEFSEGNSVLSGAQEEYNALKAKCAELTATIGESNRNLIKGMDDNSGIYSEIERIKVLYEQCKAAEEELLAQEKTIGEAITALKENEKAAVLEDKKLHDEYNACVSAIKALTEKNEEIKTRIVSASNDYEKLNHAYVSERSRMEAMQNIAEKYDGYGNAIRRVMEHKKANKGIHGVVADIIRVEKEYETAVETALGGSIQNIVTDNEDTAKELINYLKENHFGRATFLPLTSIGESRGSDREDLLKEKGAIRFASDLVENDKKFDGVIKYLLGRILVVDNMDNAVAIEKKNKYQIRIVTLEGEQFNPGGSISGGAYKNQSNLLGRKREIDEMSEKVEGIGKELAELSEEREKLELSRGTVRAQAEKQRTREQELRVSLNTSKLGLASLAEKIKDAEAQRSVIEASVSDNAAKAEEYAAQKEKLSDRILHADDYKKELEAIIARSNEELETVSAKAEEAGKKVNDLLIDAAKRDEAYGFIKSNLERTVNEIEALIVEKQSAAEESERSIAERTEREEKLVAIAEKKEHESKKLVQLDKELSTLEQKRDELTKTHEGFFATHDELSSRIVVLEKDEIRLTNQRERLEEQINSQTTYLWAEYEMTPSDAESLRNDEIKNLSQNRKEINELKSEIKGLGDVNVNAIEDYKNVSERYGFLTGQRDDLHEAEEKLVGVIEELDNEMRNQFTERFKEIQVQFDKVFRELFGGGKGTLELCEDEDVLEAGIVINAQPPGKKLQNMLQMSGGEKALTAISLLFAIQNLKPSPFCLLDEIEAALDDPNVKRFAGYLKKLTKNSQFIVITHRRGTMAAADILYGITMQEKGVSALVSVNLIEDGLK